MTDRLRDLYNNELEFLVKSSEEFAKDHGVAAKRLGLPKKGDDPHVERLIEGVALLTAGIRSRIEDDLPELTEALLGVLYPHYTRPIPAMTIVQFEPKLGDLSALMSGPIIPAGSRVEADVGKSNQVCMFRTAYEVRLWPIQMAQARYAPPEHPADDLGVGAGSLLTVGLKTLGTAKWGQVGGDFDSLKFHLHGEIEPPYALLNLLRHHVLAIEVRDPDTGHRFPLPAGSIKFLGYGPDEGVIPFPERSFLGYRNLQEYFAFPEKFFFFKLDGLAPLTDWTNSSRAEIRFAFRDPPATNLRVVPGSFRLHCTPLVNLFEKTCEAIRLDDTRVEYPLRPDPNQSMPIEVHSILSVHDGPEECRPFDAVGFRDQVAGDPRPCWYARRRQLGEQGSELSMSFPNRIAATPSANTTQRQDRKIVVKALCTNLDLPKHASLGDFDLKGPASISSIRRISEMKPPRPPKAARRAQWLLLTQLAINHESLCDPDEGRRVSTLRELLRLNDPVGDPASNAQIDGLIAVEVGPTVARLSRGGEGHVRGLAFDLRFKSSRQSSEAPFLLCSVLDQFLAHFISINSFVRLSAKVGEQEPKTWPPRTGDRILI